MKRSKIGLMGTLMGLALATAGMSPGGANQMGSLDRFFLSYAAGVENLHKQLAAVVSQNSPDLAARDLAAEVTREADNRIDKIRNLAGARGVGFSQRLDRSQQQMIDDLSKAAPGDVTRLYAADAAKISDDAGPYIQREIGDGGDRPTQTLSRELRNDLRHRADIAARLQQNQARPNAAPQQRPAVPNSAPPPAGVPDASTTTTMPHPSD